MSDETTAVAGRRQVPAVTRALAILRFLARSSEPAGVNPIARELGLVPSTCMHILRALQDEGMVEFDPQTKRYSIGIGILPLARSALHRNTFSALIQPRLSEFSAEYGVTSAATQISDSDHMIVVALSQSTMPFRLQVDLGSRFPALISATGRLFAAFNALDEATLRRRFEKLVWDHPPTFEAWMDEVRDAKERGYSADRGSYISGVTVVAVPAFAGDGTMTRSIVAIGISERLEDGQIPALAQAMQAIRDQVQDLHVDERG
ncbi:IclR family transcriptional regulator [Roseicyclus sp. F158]|uniref:IclR family transcriptional regulator n=1 Tax=Tropicimonas omnivorans TaxID=3075590 RepID=A0ABU3DKU4_9RHOB|nr:IclR family transcriptional regulator [Roseicyclus sp. F158]MDT0684291.1 IclR family transcriptional regulator [Roseicyclus sp. F158]